MKQNIHLILWILTIVLMTLATVCANMNETTPLTNLGRIVYNG